MNFLEKLASIGRKLKEKKEREEVSQIVLLREELLAVTGDHSEALMLNQFLFLHETRGEWVKASGAYLKRLCMLTLTPRSCLRLAHRLEEKKLLESRPPSPTDSDRSLSYRVNLDTLTERIRTAGFTPSMRAGAPKPNDGASDNMSGGKTESPMGGQNDAWNDTESDDLKSKRQKELKDQTMPACASEKVDQEKNGDQVPSGGELIQELMAPIAGKKGIRADVAARLCQNWPAAYLRDHLACMPERIAAAQAKGKAVPNPAGLLIKAIELGYDLPSAYLARKESGSNFVDKSQIQERLAQLIETLKTATKFIRDGKEYTVKRLNEFKAEIEVIYNGAIYTARLAKWAETDMPIEVMA